MIIYDCVLLFVNIYLMEIKCKFEPKNTSVHCINYHDNIKP